MKKEKKDLPLIFWLEAYIIAVSTHFEGNYIIPNFGLYLYFKLFHILHTNYSSNWRQQEEFG